ncbi:hypothetical protein PHLCEN_2v179 [Hermanssonia centrifuga]|uniref:Elongation factor methyltransferase 7 n=1 Tax=Hermanssonia centrifuga TaxID=98765 RepID=A0A2R6S6U9_9APHY|nr:hypothetical protein PHLCEN_2v179 [Hermanssonia centrifuga]
MSDSEGEVGFDLDAIFPEPPRPPSPEPTIATYTRRVPPPEWTEHAPPHDAHHWSEIEIRLVGSHPLWGHYLWNASRSFASYLDAHPDLYRDRLVLELGAGGGLPGLVTAKNGAKSVFVTDYPDAVLIKNLEHNVERNISPQGCVRVQGYIWGQSLDPIFQVQRIDSDDRGFELVIMSDLIFNHSQHDALLKTAELALKPAPSSSSPEPCLLVFYSHHRPHLAHRDMEFFSKATERGWLWDVQPMFPEDPGEEEVRATVHGWRLTRCTSTATALGPDPVD